MTPTASIADKLANIEKLANSGPQLSGSERAEYDRLCNRLQRARGDLRRATTRGDDKKRTSAERAIANAEAGLREFLAPKVDHLWAPPRIVAKFEARWHGRSGDGIHRHKCEMVLDRKDLSGPQYRTVRVLLDEGAPPTNAHSAPTAMGVAWFAIDDQIQNGQISVIADEEPS